MTQRRRRPQRGATSGQIETQCGGCGGAFLIDRAVLLAGGPQPCPRCGSSNEDEPAHPNYHRVVTLVPTKGQQSMPQPCSVCTHPSREEIDILLADESVSNREVARQFALSEASIRRHLKDHAESDGDEVEPEALRSIAEAREDITRQRDAALLEIQRLQTELEAAAGVAARTPNGMRVLDDLDRQIAGQQRTVERFGRMLAGLDRAAEDEQRAAEMARRAELEAVVASAEAALVPLYTAIEGLTGQLAEAATQAYETWLTADRARIQLRSSRTRSARSVIGERVAFRLHQEAGLSDMPFFPNPLGRQPLVGGKPPVDKYVQLRERREEGERARGNLQAYLATQRDQLVALEADEQALRRAWRASEVTDGKLQARLDDLARQRRDIDSKIAWHEQVLENVERTIVLVEAALSPSAEAPDSVAAD